MTRILKAEWYGPSELTVYGVVDRELEEGTAGLAFFGTAKSIRDRVFEQATAANTYGDPVGSWVSLPIPAGKVGFIDSVEVETRLRWQGWGRKIYELLAQELRDHGAHAIVLLATEDSKPFWRHLGFQVLSWKAGNLILMINRVLP